MSINQRIIKYAKENFTGVMHTTLNPDGPGVVRIHLIPPRIEGNELGMSVAIINGQDIIPVNPSWSILLNEFIKKVNVYAENAVSDEDIKNIKAKTLKGIRKVYPLVSKKKIEEDIYTIMESFTQIAKGEMPKEEVGYMSLKEYAPFMRAPHRMDLMVSSMAIDGKWHCNQKCVHCYAAGQELAEEKELSTAEWKQILDKCKEACIPQVTFTGGEPTMRDDLVELVDYAKWFVTRLNTNGINLTKELCNDLKKASLDSMQVTFYSSDSEIHNKLVGANRFDDTVNGIENALEAGLNVSINTPLCSLNRDYVKTLEFLHDKGILYVTCSGLITTGNALTENSESLQLSTDEIKEVLKEAVDYCYSHDMEISFTSPGWVEKDFLESLGIMVPTCGACLSNMAITPSGNVVPCQSWLSDNSLGNILTDSWEKIWNSEECKLHRDYSALTTGLCPLRSNFRIEDFKKNIEMIKGGTEDEK